MISATCATIAAILASASGGETIRLATGTCAPITVARNYASRVLVDATGATLKGLRVTGGGNLTWRGGTIQAADGAAGVAVGGYGVYLRGATNVTIENVKLTAAKKAMVLDGATLIVIANNLFDKVGEDGIIASGSSRVNVIGNIFQNTLGKPTVCTFLNGTAPGLSQRDCVARGGLWVDGYHPDAIQMRNGMNGVLVSGNTVKGDSQGITQMDTPGDAPLRSVQIDRNTVAVDAGHSITLGDNCVNCTIRWNTVTRGVGSTFKTAVRPGAALACGNKVQDVQTGTAACA